MYDQLPDPETGQPGPADRPSQNPVARHAFPIFWSAQTLSLLGLQVSGLAMPLTAMTVLDADTRTLSLISAAGQAPWIIFGLLAGAVVDRLPRRTMIMISHLGRALIMISVPVCWLLGTLSVPQLIMVSVGVGLLAMIFEISYHAYLPGLVPADSLTEANRRLAITDGTARAGGPAIAGVVIQAIGGPLAMVIPAGCHLACGIGTLLLPNSRRPSQRLRPADVIGGGRLLWNDRRLRGLVLQEMSFGFGFAFSSAAVLIRYAEAGLSSSMIGMVLGIAAVAGIAGSIGSRRLAVLIGDHALMRIGLAMRVGGLLMLPLLLGGLDLLPSHGVAATVAVSAICRAIQSAGWSIWDIPRLTIMQSSDPATLGRINGTALFSTRTCELLGAGAAALAAAAIGPGMLIVTGASVAGMATVGYLLRR